MEGENVTQRRIDWMQIIHTPTGPGVKPGCSKDCVQTRLERRVFFEVICPRWRGLECITHGIRGGTWISRDERVNLVDGISR
jgi:hypothetical protein